MLTIIPCGSRKNAEPAPAQDLYLGSQFKLTLQAAKTIQARKGGRLMILSGLHGLVDLDQILAPYEMRVGSPGSISLEALQAQAQALGLAGEAEVVVLAGKDYAALARAIWPHAQTPLLGLGGIGFQRQALSRMIKGLIAV